MKGASVRVYYALGLSACVLFTKGRTFYFLKGMFKMQKTSKKILCALLAVAMLLSVCPAAFAATSATFVEFSYYNGEFVMAPTEIDVYDGLAEEYGYQNAEGVNGITVLDALVAAHIVYYGDEFTPETAANYITCSYGYLSKAFGEANDLLFSVNGKTPNDGVLNPDYGQCTGYSIDAAEVVNEDKVMLYAPQDMNMWYDHNTSFDKDSYTVTAGESFKANVTGVCLTWYGCCVPEDLAKHIVPMEGVKVQYTEDFETYKDAGTIDAEGNVEITIDTEGDYYLVTSGPYTVQYDEDDTEEIPTVSGYAKVTVAPKGPNFFIPKGITASLMSVDDYQALVIEITLKDLFGNAKKDKVNLINIPVNNPVMEAIAGIIVKMFG